MERNRQTAIPWRELLVTDDDGHTCGTLCDMVELAPANLDTATLADNGAIIEWPQWFISAPGEDPDSDTPHRQVDWNGFSDALDLSRG